MSLAELLKKETSGNRRDLAIAIAVSGAANATLIPIINTAAKSISKDNAGVQYLLMFIVAIALYVVGLKYTFDRANRIFESMANKIRVRLVEKIADSELLLLDRIGKAEVYKRIVQDTTRISESQGILVAGLHASVMMICTALYLLFLSWPAFLATAVLVAGGVAIFTSKEQELLRQMQLTGQKEVEFISLTDGLIGGLKEVKLSQARARDLLEDLRRVSRNTQESRLETGRINIESTVFSQSFFYVLIAVIVFLLPRFASTDGHVVTQIITAILFIIGPLSVMVNAAPAYAKANMAAESIYELEQQVDAFHREFGAAEFRGRRMSFRHKIELEGLKFSYDAHFGSGFTAGPVNLTIEKGEVIMLIGGNGSGKSTVLKLLTGLYYPSSGIIKVDGRPVGRNNLQNYRELYSAIFSDFHLFPKLYGLPEVSDDEVAELLDLMEIGDKTAFFEGKFENLELSTGQRKRLALVVLLLENRPVIVFDEWAADQDPEFRKYFYEVLLQRFKKEGKTVIATSHDDRYFHLADRVVKMDMGAIEFVKDLKQPSA